MDTTPPRPELLGDRPGDRYIQSTTWDELLSADGWTPHHIDSTGEQHWVRPGKDRREGSSATVGYQGTDLLHVFTSSVPGLDPDTSYNRFGYYTATRHDGDFTTASRALTEVIERRTLTEWLAVGTPMSTVDPDTGEILEPEPTNYIQDALIDWGTIRDTINDQQWEIGPLIAQGRSHLLYAEMKSGKSLLLQWVLSRACLGMDVFDRHDTRRRRVLYIDAENSVEDVVERLENFGIDTAELAEAGTFHYALLPVIVKGIDHHEDARTIVEMALKLEVDIVVIDTAPSMVAGEENSADTWADVARLVTRPLKTAGIASIRVDHLGKTGGKGLRGSSAKVADADLVWKLTNTDDNGFKLYRKYSRMPWVPETIELARNETANGTLTWTMSEHTYPDGTRDLAAEMDRLGLPVDITSRPAKAALRDSPVPHRSDQVGAAIRWRRQVAKLAQFTNPTEDH